MTGVMTILDPGMFTTVQDLGRVGFAAEGVPESGAADPLSLRVGNRILGNPDGAAALEFTLNGPTISFSRGVRVCVAGGVCTGVPPGVPVLVRAGESLAVGVLKSGARASLCVDGGLSVSGVMGSASTLTSAGIGGYEGRTLRSGDTVALGNAGKAAADPAHARVAAQWLGGVLRRRTLRVAPGLHAARFPESSWASLLDSEFTVSERSNRVGVRLAGPTVSSISDGIMLSEATAIGCVQIPGDGQPIILGVDRPTTGGYPMIACVIAADLPVVGTLRPRERIRFELVTIEDAWAIWARQEADLNSLLPSSFEHGSGGQS